MTSTEGRTDTGSEGATGDAPGQNPQSAGGGGLSRIMVSVHSIIILLALSIYIHMINVPPTHVHVKMQAPI